MVFCIAKIKNYLIIPNFLGGIMEQNKAAFPKVNSKPLRRLRYTYILNVAKLQIIFEVQ